MKQETENDNQTNLHPKYMNVNTAAAYCCLSKSTLDKYRVTGNGPMFIKLGKKVVYELTDLDGWIAQNKHANTAT